MVPKAQEDKPSFAKPPFQVRMRSHAYPLDIHPVEESTSCPGTGVNHVPEQYIARGVSGVLLL